MPTREATTRLHRKLVDVIGEEETDARFELVWEARGRQIADFLLIDGTTPQEG